MNYLAPLLYHKTKNNAIGGRKMAKKDFGLTDEQVEEDDGRDIH
jgi:hypothetical protein